MQYYTFELDEPSQELYIIFTPFGNYKYKQLPMGFKCTPAFDQQDMEEVLHNIDNTGVYLNNIGAFLFTWEHHILLLEKSSTCWRLTASLLIHLNANEPFKKLIGPVTGSHPQV